MLLNHTNAKNSLLNKYLNKLADMAGITKKLSMHIARHSFANIARQKKANVYDISKALGHSSIKITESYLSSFDTKTQDETMKKVYGDEDNNEAELLKLLKGLNPEQIALLLQKAQNK
jgi:site-specific recombinase XerD